MTGRISWDMISFRPRKRPTKRSTKERKVEAYDTETENGYVRIIASSKAWYEVKSANACLYYLCTHASRDTINVFFNLAYDVECMFKAHPKVLTAWMNGKTAECAGYKLDYIKGKCLTIRDTAGHTWKFYDIAQFFLSSLANAALQYLKAPVHEFKSSRATLFKDHTISEIGAYCQDDCDKTRQLGELLLWTMKRLKVPTNRLYSCGHLAQSVLLRDYEPCTAFNIPAPVNRAYWEAYRGGWFDTYIRGHVDATIYDISSAYPAVLKEIPDFRRGHWITGTEIESNWGVIRVRICGHCPLGQSIAIQQRGSNIYPTFDKEYTCWMTVSEYMNLPSNLNSVVLEGFYWVPDGNLLYPYHNLIDDMYKVKQSYPKDTMQYMLSKRIMNSLYGKTCELIHDGDSWRAGRLFNPVVAAEVTARTRARIAKAIRGHENHVVSILTDAVIFDKDIKIDESPGLGGWEAKCHNKPAVIVQTGVYQVLGDKPATRGFSRANDLFEVLKKGGTTFKTRTLRPLHYSECIKANDIERIGCFKEVMKFININNDKKRIWREPITDVSDLLNRKYKSVAVPYSLISPSEGT